MAFTRSVRFRFRFRAVAPVLLVVGLLVSLTFTPVAAAQGTQGSLPDPISTRELMRYADRLDLSAEQRHALESLHDEYKRDFRTLREGEIATFLDEMRSMQSIGGMPKRETMEAFFKRMEQLEAKIKRRDNRLFDRLQTLLTEEQSAMLPRVRLARERQRYRSQQMMAMMTMGRPMVDLSKTFLELT